MYGSPGGGAHGDGSFGSTGSVMRISLDRDDYRTILRPKTVQMYGSRRELLSAASAR
jgi:hypothetical protein